MTDKKKAIPAKKVTKAAPAKKAATPVKKIEPAVPAAKKEKVVKVPKEIPTEDLKAIAVGRGITVGNMGIEKLKDALDLPDRDEKVVYMKKKDEKPTEAVYKGWFKCPLTGVIYANMLVGKKKAIKQMSKVERVK